MSRVRRMGRPALALALVVALLAGACSGDGGGGGDDAADDGADRSQPNVVVVITDDQTVAMMEALGRTRELVGAEGTTFTRATVSMPLCCPARATLLTGQLPHTTGVRDNLAPDGGFTRLDWSRTVATELQAAGYRTAHVGRTLNDYTVDARPLVPPGWDEWYTPLEDNTRSFIASGATVVANGEIVSLSPLVHTDDALGEVALGLIDEWVDGDAPFYLELGSVAPHTARPKVGEPGPLPVPADRHVDGALGARRPELVPDEPGKPDWVTAGDPVDPGALDRYWARALESLQAVDEAIASIVGRLDRAGALDDTVVLVTSDNGIALGEHGLGLDKVTPYEPSVRIPLLVRGPGFPAGESDLPVSHVDVAPTILTAAGLDVPAWMEGVPIQEALADPGTAARRVQVVESPPSARPAPPFLQIRSGDLVLTRYETGEAELTDLGVDPDQARNLVDDPAYGDDLVALDAAAAVLRSCSGDRCVVYDEEARP
ncbi:MAG TPA: sulfatase [Iamia sp.]|nr:sulfatase [Iamia sp.]